MKGNGLETLTSALPKSINPRMKGSEASVVFFLQMFLILGCCRLVGHLVRRIGQPAVVGEMIAGVIMGPSLFGYFLPELQKQIFPKESLTFLYVGAQCGVGLYMFLVGAEFRTDLFRNHVRGALSVSLAGMLVPFVLAVAIGAWLIGIPGLFSEKANLPAVVLFMGAAMSITAFPMLARIIHEHGLSGTRLGTLALSAGAIDDAAAWCVLAVVLSVFNGAGAVTPMITICGGLAYALLVPTLGKRLLAPLGAKVEQEGKLNHAVLATVLMLFCLAAWFTDAIGIHAVFGGVILGTAMPRGLFAKLLRQKVEPFAVVFLLPMFFTYSGLNTRLDIVNSAQLLSIALVVILASTIGKGVACWAAARFHGEENRTALAIGSLMNARGLMELIILNIGLQRGLIQPALFSIMVLMAIVTTLMASPLFEWFYGRHMSKPEAEPASVS